MILIYITCLHKDILSSPLGFSATGNNSPHQQVMELLLFAQGTGNVPGAGRCLVLTTSAWELQAFLYTESCKHAIKVLHLISNCVKNSKAYLHSKHMLLLLPGCFPRRTVERGRRAARAACSPVQASLCPNAAGICLSLPSC